MNDCNIKEVRKVLNLTQAELAEKLDLNKHYVSLIERGDRNLSEKIALKLSRLLISNPNPNMPNIWIKYRIGNNFASIIEALRNKGVPLSTLRDEDFKVMGSDLSYMYLGLKEIPLHIKEVLEEKYNINIAYLEQGKKVPMFRGDVSSDIEIPYFEGIPLDQVITILNEGHVDNYPSLTINSNLNLFASDESIEAFVDFNEDNRLNYYNGKCIIGITSTDLNIDNYGKLFVIKFVTGKVQVRRIFLGSQENMLILKTEEPNAIEIPVFQKDIEQLFEVKTVIINHFR